MISPILGIRLHSFYDYLTKNSLSAWILFFMKRWKKITCDCYSDYSDFSCVLLLFVCYFSLFFIICTLSCIWIHLWYLDDSPYKYVQLIATIIKLFCIYESIVHKAFSVGFVKSRVKCLAAQIVAYGTHYGTPIWIIHHVYYCI